MCIYTHASLHGPKNRAVQQVYALRHLLKLFQATVSKTGLYVAGPWTFAAQREGKLKVAQRRVLRSMLQKTRKQTKVEEEEGRGRRQTREGARVQDSAEYNGESEEMDSGEDSEEEQEEAEEMLGEAGE